MLDWILLQGCRYKLHLHTASKECKNSDAVVTNQLLAADNDAVAYQMEQYKNLGLVIIFHCLNSL